MNRLQGTISENTLAEYTVLMRYTYAWRKLDLGLLKQALMPDSAFDAPGIPFNVFGAENVPEAHKVFFDNLRKENERQKATKSSFLSSSCYSVITQIYPYEHEMVLPFMQLRYFTEHQFLKLVYFFVDLDNKLERIQRIKTHSTKFLINSPSFKSTLKQIQLQYTSLSN